MLINYAFIGTKMKKFKTVKMTEIKDEDFMYKRKINYLQRKNVYIKKKGRENQIKTERSERPNNGKQI